MTARECTVCRARRMGRAQQFYMVQGETAEYVFDIEKALQIAKDGRAPMLASREIVARFLTVNTEWVPEHLKHVDMQEPGIVGERYGALVLVDGTHRAARSVAEGKDFYVYRLTADETRDCMMVTDGSSGGVAPYPPEQIAAELRGVLRNNPQTEIVEADVVSTDSEEEIRRLLSPAENARVRLKVQKLAALLFIYGPAVQLVLDYLNIVNLRII